MGPIMPVHTSWVTTQLGDSPAVELPPSPAAADLDNLEQENYHFSISAALSLGFPIATFSATASHAALLLGTTRYKDVIGANNHVFRFGVALRALIVITTAKIDFALTLPIVAAKVQLGLAEASAQLLVQGYKGALGASLPAWQDFDVDSYSSYMKHVSDLQTKILDDAANIVPVLLGTSAVPAVAGDVSAPPAAAIGVVYALQAIAHGASLSHALDKFPPENEQARSAVKSVYAEKVGNGDNTQPDQTAQENARTELLGFHLDSRHFQIPFLVLQR